MRTQDFQFYPLAGIDQRVRPPQGSADLVVDMYRPTPDSWRECGGIRQILPDAGSPATSPFEGEGGIQSLHWFAQHNGARQWLIWETSGGELRYFNGSTGGWTDVLDYDGDAWDGTVRARNTVKTPWQRTQSQSFNGRLYLVNGIDEPVVFNGRCTDRAGFSTPPPAPVGTVLQDYSRVDGWVSGDVNWRTGIVDQGLGRLASAGGEEVQCAYRYVVTFLNERGQESPPSQPSEMICFLNGDGVSERDSGTGGRSYVYVQLPIGGPEVVARRVYRTRNILNSDGEALDLGFGSNFYFLREFQDNVVTSFEDFTPDSGLGSVLDPLDFGPWPTSAKFLAAFKNTMFVCGTQDNVVRFSRPLFPEVFPEDNAIDLSDSQMGPISGMYASQDSLIVFKTNGIHLIRSTSDGGFSASTLSKDIGCIAPNSARDVPGVGVMFLASDGIYAITGSDSSPTYQSIVNVSQHIKKLMNRVNRAASVNACAVVNHRDKEYMLSVPNLGSDKNNLMLVFHYETGDWSTREGFPAACMVESRDHRSYVFMGSNDPTDKPGVMVYSHGWPDKLNDEAITPKYQSSPTDFGALFSSVQPAGIMVYALARGESNMVVDYIVNRSSRSVRADLADQTMEQQDPNDEIPTYGDCSWGSFYWGSERAFIARFDISVTHAGPCRELAVSIESDTSRLHIVSYSLSLKVGEQRLIKPLNPNLNPDKG